jgi:ubiquinol-cytochrome c reductase cytochrome c subunit
MTMSETKLIHVVAAALGLAGAASSAMAAPAADPQVERGHQLYMANGCYQCHGTVGQGGNAGSKLAPNPLPAAAIMAIIRKPIRDMPPYNKAALGDADVTAIHAYLASIKPAPAVDSLPQLRPPAARP